MSLLSGPVSRRMLLRVAASGAVTLLAAAAPDSVRADGTDPPQDFEQQLLSEGVPGVWYALFSDQSVKVAKSGDVYPDHPLSDPIYFYTLVDTRHGPSGAQVAFVFNSIRILGWERRLRVRARLHK